MDDFYQVVEEGVEDGAGMRQAVLRTRPSFGSERDQFFPWQGELYV